MKSSSRSPVCPRCGYDLSGMVSAWETSCPVEGVCTECGLEFGWGEVLGRLFVPGWSIESLRHESVWQYAGTWRRAVRPWVLWRHVRLSVPVRARRLAVYAVLCFLVMHAVFVVGGLWAAFWGFRHSMWWSGRGLGSFFEWHSAGDVGLFVLWPYGPQEYGYHNEELVPLLSMNETQLLAMLVSMTVLIPLGFFLLPDTRRKCRVRQVHVWRAMAYSWTLLPVWAAVVAAVPMWMAWRDTLWDDVDWLPSVGMCGVGVLALWLVVFWWVTVRFYMRLPHATGVVIALTVIAWLATLAGAWMLYANFA